MTVEKERYERILQSLVLGNPIAEHDSILEQARVDTPVFDGFLANRYDIVTGRKGAGKTAIFKIVGNELRDYFIRWQNRVVLTGVNSSGESVFSQFKIDFERFTEDDFENFWKIYFITLVYNDFLKNPEFAENLKKAEKEISEFKKACSKAGIPNIPSQQGKQEMIEWVVATLKSPLKRIKSVKGAAGIDPNTSLFGVSMDIDMAPEVEEPAKRTAVYVHEVGKALAKVLEKSGYRVWIILDRLDEVFDRYSTIEFRGLRGLLKAYRSFDIGQSDLFGVKLFLRDDIKQFLTDDKIYKKFFGGSIPPLAAATHIFSKESPVLSWSQDEIEKLILYRLSLSRELRDFIGMAANGRQEVEQELRSKEARLKYWNKIFPEKISTMSSLKWIYTRLRDSNGVVTPRSVIDLLNGAADFQKQNLQVNFEDSPHIFPEEAIKQGHATASKSKLINDIYNEFPKEQKNIMKLADGKGKLSKDDLKTLYGDDWESVVETLRRIGILRLVKHSDDYMVEFLFRPALEITYKS